jgi:hypothetical protein
MCYRLDKIGLGIDLSADLGLPPLTLPPAGWRDIDGLE